MFDGNSSSFALAVAAGAHQTKRRPDSDAKKAQRATEWMNANS
jgi:hypothetical protein